MHGTINPIIASDLANIQTASAYAGTSISPLDLNHNLLNFQVLGSTVQRFPSARVDYNLTPNFRLTGFVNESNMYNTNQGGPPYPGPLFSNQGYRTKKETTRWLPGLTGQ